MPTNDFKVIRIMRKNFLMNMFSCFFFFILARLIHNEFSILRESFKGDYYFLIPPALIFFVGLISAPFLKRILVYWVIDIIMSILPIILIFIAFFTVSISEAFGYFPILFIGFYLSIILGIKWLLIKQQELAFNRATIYNKKSGVLDLKSGSWDLTKDCHWDTPKNEERGKTKAYRLFVSLSAFATGIGFILGRNLSSDQNRFMDGIFFFFMASILTIVSAPKLNRIFQTIRWEREIGKKILINLIKE